MDLAFRPKNNTPHYSFYIQSELGQLLIRLDWQTTKNNFVVRIDTASGVNLISGGLLGLGLNSLNGYPEWGALTLAGDQPTLSNLGLSNELRWLDLESYQHFVDNKKITPQSFADVTLTSDLQALLRYNSVMPLSLRRLISFEDWRSVYVGNN